MAPLEILIVGCSIAGPSLASFLLLSPLPAHEKPRITILERSAEMRMRGQNIDIRGTGVTLIRKLGIEQLIRNSLTDEEGVHFVDTHNNNVATFAADKTGQIQTGTSDIEILRGRLAEICWRRSETLSDDVKREGGAGIEYIFGDTLDQLDQDGEKVHVRFAKSGAKRSFDLVVGADGLQSSVRKLAWGAAKDQEHVHRLGLYMAFFSMPAVKTDDLWRRWYQAPRRRGAMIRPHEQHDRVTVSMYTFNDGDDQRLPDAAIKGRDALQTQKDLMAEYWRDGGWQAERMIREMYATDDFYYDMVGQVKMDKWSKGRVVLIGDAGYCPSPISGMGTTVAFNGAYTLAGALVSHPNDLDAALAQYEERLRPLVTRAQKLMPGGPRLIHPETEWGIAVLHAILGFIYWTGIHNLIFRFAGPPANAVPVEEYGFRQAPMLTR